MKRSGLVLLLAMATASWGQTTTPAQPQASQAPTQTFKRPTVGNKPALEELYCSGFVSAEKIPQSRYVVGGWNSFDQTRYGLVSDYIYIHGHDIKAGDRFSIVRQVRDPNAYESYKGQRGAVRDAGSPYFELGYVKVVDVQKDTAVAVAELSCADFVPGDIAVPFVEREAPVFRVVSLDRFAPPSGGTSGRIIMAKDFDAIVGSKSVVYLNVGTDKGVKIGDYFRATRTYSASYHDPVESMGRSASANEDTQKAWVKLSAGDASNLPRRTLGDMVVLQVQRKSATALVLTSLEDIHVGDGVEVMDVSSAPELQPVKPVSQEQPNAAVMPGDIGTAAAPRITCSASPASVRAGERSTISCDAASPDSRPVNITFVSNGGRLSSSRNQATLDTTDTGAGPISVRATAFDDRQLSASAVTTVNVESATPVTPTAQKLGDLDFKPNSAYVDNRSKAILDDLALKLQQDPGSTAVLSGAAEEKEPSRLATQRAENSKTYLTKSKGIDAQRIQTKAGAESSRKVEIVTLPAGAVAPASK
jgi:outer membrane protein OmpA-like peptidoglycan-associated protein